MSDNTPQYQSRKVRKDDYIAEAFEAEASRLPRSMKSEADLYRATAKRLRESSDPTIICVADVPSIQQTSLQSSNPV
jgi:hypothetical protein